MAFLKAPSCLEGSIVWIHLKIYEIQKKKLLYKINMHDITLL